MQKRIPKEKIYVPYSIPQNRHCPIFTRDMDEEINCSNCGKETTFGICYTSKIIHNPMGFGYPVCEECYKKELQ